MRFTISHLTVEYLEHPMGIETQTPKFGWWLDAAENGLLQAAYQIVVTKDEQIMWNSQKVCSDKVFQIPYEGDTLEPETQYTWTVTVWDQQGDKESASSTFETGLMCGDIKAWEGAEWIGSNELPLYTNALSVFKMNCSLQLSGDSVRGGFMFGGDDPRLLDRNMNLMLRENKPGESYCSLVLDIAELAEGTGAGKVLVYRQGYDASDVAGEPLFSLEVDEKLINKDNMRDEHTLYMECEYGQLELFLDGEDDEHRLLPQPDPNPLRNRERRLNLNPVGRGGDFTCFPVVAKVGLFEEKDAPVTFKNLEIRNYRKPCNVLYSGIPGKANELADVSCHGNTMLAASFHTETEKEVKRARVYATARGIYELYLNGSRVGEEYLTPGMSQYDQHHFYQIYDVTESIANGANSIGAVLAEGWFSGSISYTGSNWNYFGDRNSLLLKLVIEYTDGTRDCVVTSPENWNMTDDGPIRYASFFQGEIMDMRKEDLLTAFTKPCFSFEGWQKAQCIACDDTTACINTPLVTVMNTVQPGLNYENTQLLASPEPGVSIVAKQQAVAVTEPRKGMFIYDFGQNIAGIPCIEIEGKEGQEICLRYAEVLYPEGEEYAAWTGTLMLENIRGALNTDRFILREGKQVLKPTMTFHGYRYMEITGIEEPLPLSLIHTLAFSSIKEMAAEFTCSNAMINRLYQNICWSLRDNFISIPTDCPQRNERMGWSGDLSVFGRTASYMSLSDPFLRKHMIALKDTQVNGRFADIAPIGGGFGGTLWGSVGITVPWEMYLQYGDETVLADMYDNMSSYINFLKTTKNAQGIVQDGPLGDWLGPENSMNESAYLWQCYYLYDLDIMRKTAKILGKEDDEKAFTEEYETARKAFVDTYRDPETGKSVFSCKESAMSLNSPFEAGEKQETPKKTVSGKYLIDTQTSYAVPLGLGLYTEEEKKLAANYLNEACTRPTVDDLHEERKPYTLMTGFIGTSWISQALSENGLHETAWRMLKETSYPSWLYPVKNGATTIWERLNSYTVENGFGGNNSMNSFNHYSFGAVGTWMLAYAGGIRRDEKPGTFRISPVPDPDKDIHWVNTTVQTVSGEYKVNWEITEQGISYSFYIPGGRKTPVDLPMSRSQAEALRDAMEQDKRFENIVVDEKGLSFVAVPGNYVMI